MQCSLTRGGTCAPLQWECRVLTNGWPRKFQESFLSLLIWQVKPALLLFWFVCLYWWNWAYVIDNLYFISIGAPACILCLFFREKKFRMAEKFLAASSLYCAWLGFLTPRWSDLEVLQRKNRKQAQKWAKMIKGVSLKKQIKDCLGWRIEMGRDSWKNSPFLFLNDLIN